MAFRTAAEDIIDWERLKGNTTNRQQTTHKVSNPDFERARIINNRNDSPRF